MSHLSPKTRLRHLGFFGEREPMGGPVYQPKANGLKDTHGQNGQRVQQSSSRHGVLGVSQHRSGCYSR